MYSRKVKEETVGEAKAKAQPGTLGAYEFLRALGLPTPQELKKTSDALRVEREQHDKEYREALADIRIRYGDVSAPAVAQHGFFLSSIKPRGTSGAPQNEASMGSSGLATRLAPKVGAMPGSASNSWVPSLVTLASGLVIGAGAVVASGAARAVPRTTTRAASEAAVPSSWVPPLGWLVAASLAIAVVSRGWSAGPSQLQEQSFQFASKGPR